MPRTEAWWICRRCRKRMGKVGKPGVMAALRNHMGPEADQCLNPGYRIEQLPQTKKK